MTSPLTLTISREVLCVLDEQAVLAHNRRAKPKHTFRLELGPSAFEGDIDRARVVMLLGNPGLDKTSTVLDHTFARAGWPLAALHPEAPPGVRGWWHARLRELIFNCGPEVISQRLACLQIIPWASEKFCDVRLPSRQLLLDVASQCASRGAVIVIMRAERFWLQSAPVAASPHRYRANSWRSSYLSSGNLSESGWKHVVKALSEA